MRILQFVQNDKKGSFSSLFCQSKHIIHGRIPMRRHVSDDALMPATPCLLIQEFLILIVHENAPILCKGQDLSDGSSCSLLHYQPLDLTSALQRLRHRVAPDEHITFVFFHI